MQMRNAAARVGLLLSCGLLLGACETVGDLFTGNDPERIPGERIPIAIASDERLEPDPQLATVDVVLPPPYRNEDWTQPGGYPSNALYHLEAAGDLSPVFDISVGDGSDSSTRLTATPIIAGGRIFVLDAVAQIRAFDASSGETVWEVDLTPEVEEDSETGFGGGVAFDGGRVFVTTGFGFAVALDAASGTEIWRYKADAPLRAAPVVNGGRVFILTQENQLIVLAEEDGRVLWNHQGISETAAILGSTSVAVAGDVVVVGYSSGELYAMRIENGRVLWNDSLTRTTQLSNAMSSINAVAGRPVIDRGLVYAISHAGRFVAIDIRSGERVWTRDVGGIETPWAAGDFVYVLTSDENVVCLSRKDGRVKWVSQLPRVEDETDEESAPIDWSGPVLVSDRLILVSSHGRAVSLSPYTGEPLGEIEIPDGTYIAPIVANGTLYLLTDAAHLVALR